jgi:ABC-type branched-subunit amino acid transport system permease subunit
MVHLVQHLVDGLQVEVRVVKKVARVEALLAALVGLPVLRVRGPYFVILTFGLAELVKYTITWAESASGMASRILFGAPDLQVIYFSMFALAVIAVVPPSNAAATANIVSQLVWPARASGAAAEL